ncbi:TetR/AcrR family transcriptional regulator [Micromonospora sp. CB01531]|uniref:TetR/AcrR family transcriptional regulator n=1 Tax=Micromonospora sp. CB01531 TaxID=1718947 RepID=UPI000940668F|nr:TetR/AcrR family transcriptional regulator [Micromonospora sp. CB01531]
MTIDSTWERILRTSAELFARNGYHATGIAELSAELELSRGALYHYIDGKQSLLFEISRTQVQRLNKLANEIAERDVSARTRLRELARSLLRNISDHRAEWTVFFTDFGALTGERRAEIYAARDEYESYWRRVVEDGVRGGEFREAGPIMVKGLLGMFNYTYLWMSPDGELTAEQVADSFLDMVLSGLDRTPTTDEPEPGVARTIAPAARSRRAQPAG